MAILLSEVVADNGAPIVAGQVRDVAPRELTFRFDTAVDPATLSGIQILRSGINVTPLPTGSYPNGFLGIGDRPSEVVVRFQAPLPDDFYQITIFGTGANPLRDLSGAPFNSGLDSMIDFRLALGAQVVGVVPQPITGVGQQLADVIEVYFNDDDLNAAAAQDPSFYRLIFTNNTATNTDDVVHEPASVVYDSVLDKATLTFANDLDELTSGPGTYRLRIGGGEGLARQGATEVPLAINTGLDAGSSYGTAQQLTPATALGRQGMIVSGAILPQGYDLTLPGANNEPGHREIAAENHLSGTADTVDGITTIYYDFRRDFGVDPFGNPLINVIQDSPAQVQRAREVLEFYANYLGVQFVETAPALGTPSIGFTIATGDMRAVSPTADQASGDGITGIAGTPNVPVDTATGLPIPVHSIALAIMDSSESALWGSSEFGGNYFREAMREIGQLLGYGLATEQAHLTMNRGDLLFIAAGGRNTVEPIFPGDHDIVHGQHLYRPESNDIDLYRFDVTANGTFRGETFAERLATSSLLDTVITLFGDVQELVVSAGGGADVSDGQTFVLSDGVHTVTFEFDDVNVAGVSPGNQPVVFTTEDTADEIAAAIAEAIDDAPALNIFPTAQFNRVKLRGATSADVTGAGTLGLELAREMIASNDDYHSEDSLLELKLSPGTYYVGVTARGNSQYDPTIINSGFGGTSQGQYQLRVNFTPDITDTLTDGDGTALDGDVDGVPGGNFNFWFQVGNDANTIYVDKSFTGAQQGTLGSPFNNIQAAFAAAVARPGNEIVRVVGNGGADGDLSTLADNLVYAVGFNTNGLALGDGTTLNVPRGVTMMVDAGAIFKMRLANIDVGSSAQNIDRSQGHLQVLGIPGQPVHFTSALEDMRDGLPMGNDVTPIPSVAAGGNWGGIVFRNNLDYAEGRTVLEREGIFLNYVNQADIRFGGGDVTVNSISQRFTPIHMTESRPTISNNTISRSADAAMSADPRSFADTKFQGVDYTADYERIGPHIRRNTLAVRLPNGSVAQNSVNGLFVRIRTQVVAGQANVLDLVDRDARMDDTDIPHILAENLIIQGTPEGAALSGSEVLVLTGLAVEESILGEPSNDTIATAVQTTLPIVPAGQYRVFRDTGVIGDNPSLIVNPDPDRDVDFFRFDLAAGSRVTINVNVLHDPLDIIPTLDANLRLFDSNGVQLAFNDDAPGGAENFFGANVDPYLEFVATTTGTYYVAVAGSDNRTYNPNVEGSGATSGVFSTGFYDLEISVSTTTANLDSRLRIDPGLLIKAAGSRIETQIGANLIAEGEQERPIVFTSLRDDRFGGGGTFDTNADQANTTTGPGDWGGIFLGHLSQGSLDHLLVTFAGGLTRIEGTSDRFNALEIHQAEARVANSIFERNATGLATTLRSGRAENAEATIFVRGAQPILVNNIIRNSLGTAISINANSMQWQPNADWGLSTGWAQSYDELAGNQGPLLRGNRYIGNAANALEIRGGTLTTQTVWDDTDIVHLVRDEIVVANHHVFSGLRLQSSPTEGLVVKLFGATAGFTAEGDPLDINDRIGGTVQVAGTPSHPVILTSLNDGTVGAGLTPDGQLQTDTSNTGIIATSTAIPAPMIDQFTDSAPNVDEWYMIADASGTISVQVYDEDGGVIDIDGLNSTPTTPQSNTTITLTGVVPGSQHVFRHTLATGLGLTHYRPQFSGTAQVFLKEDRLSPNDVFNSPSGTGTQIGSNLELGFDERFDTLPSAFADTTWFYDLAVGDQFTWRGFFDSFPGGADAARIDLIDPSGAIVSSVTTGPFLPVPGTTLTTTVAAGQAGFWGVKITAPATITPFAGHYLMDVEVTNAGVRNATKSERHYLLETSLLSSVSQGQPGEWRSVRLEEYSNDRNVEATYEREAPQTNGVDVNGTPATSQVLGLLAPDLKGGDENRRLGFEVRGFVSDNPLSGGQIVDATGSPISITTERVHNLVTGDRVHIAGVAGNTAANGHFTVTATGPTAFILNGSAGNGAYVASNNDLWKPDAGDVDVYSFLAEPGAEVWIDVDRTTSSLDTVIELVDADGDTIARSDDSHLEQQNPALLTGLLPNNLGRGLQRDAFNGQDVYTTNPRDAGMRLVLPGAAGQVQTYFIRVYSKNAVEAGNPAPSPFQLGAGDTSGHYQFQIRLQEADEVPGSVVRYSDISFATTGIEVFGLPAHSPLLGDIGERSNDTNDEGNAAAIDIGNILQSDLGSMSIAGALAAFDDVDWYEFTVDYDQIDFEPGLRTVSLAFDLDYADGIGLPDTVITVFDSLGRVVLVARDSDVLDDQPGPTPQLGTSDLSRGTFGKLDPYIGPQQFPAGQTAAPVLSQTYFVAVSSNAQLPTALNMTYQAAAANATIRLEPVQGVRRIAEDHIGFNGHSSGQGTTLFTTIEPVTPSLIDVEDSISLQANVKPFTLADVPLFVTNGFDVFTVNANTGLSETFYNNALAGFNETVEDIDFRSDGRLFGYATAVAGGNQDNAGRLIEISTQNGAVLSNATDSIPDAVVNTSQVDALTIDRTGADAAGVPQYNFIYYSVRDPSFFTPFSYLFDANAGGNANVTGAGAGNRGLIGTIMVNTPGDVGVTTGLAFDSNGFNLFGVTDQGHFIAIDTFGFGGTGLATILLTIPGLEFQGLTQGPQNMDFNQDGVYGDFANTFFAITTNGELVAIEFDQFTGTARQVAVFDADGNGVLENVLQTDTGGFGGGFGGPTGLAFSPVDFNLWHPTMNRRADAGHGINASFDQARFDPQNVVQLVGNDFDLRTQRELEGGASMYYGLEQWVLVPTPNDYFTYSYQTNQGFQTFSNAQYGVLLSTAHRDLMVSTGGGDNYQLPGGAKGSLQTNAFSLQGYAATDKPTLYFNYFLDTENVNSTTILMRDSARVQISADGGVTWFMLATNNGSGTGGPSDPFRTNASELPRFASASSNVDSNPATLDPRQRVQELFDNTGGWRQARVDLGEFAGQSNLLVRFDFSSAGSMNEGIPGDDFARFFHQDRYANNANEGFYVDDVIIGFAERGEMVTNSQTNAFAITPVPPNPNGAAPQEVLSGAYQLEIRAASEYGANIFVDASPVINGPSFVFPEGFIMDTNDRLTEGFTLLAPQPEQFRQTLTQSDNLFAPNVLDLEFTNALLPTGAGTLTFTAFGDLAATNEFLTVNIEGVVVQNLFVTGGQFYSPVTATIQLTQAQLQTLTADGVINVTVTPSAAVQDVFLLTPTSLQATLVYGVGSFAPEGETFTINDGLASVTFEFDSAGGVRGTNRPVPYLRTQSAGAIAATMVTVINAAGLGVSATATPTSNRVNLNGAAFVTTASTFDLSVQLNAGSVRENGPATQARILREGPTTNGVFVQVTAIDPLTGLPSDEINLNGFPLATATIFIPAGASQSALFNVAARDDLLIDLTQTAVLVATLVNFNSVSAPIDITDDELGLITVSINMPTIAENAGAAAAIGTVTISSPAAGDLVISLLSSDFSEATSVGFVVIPQGQTSATFDVDAVPDFVLDGPKLVKFTASAVGLTSGVGTVTVNDLGNVIPFLPFVGPNINASQSPAHDFEPVIMVNPANPSNLFMASSQSTGTGLRGSVSFDGGLTWTARGLATGGDGLVRAADDVTGAFDQFGNLFIAYLGFAQGEVVVAQSIDGGLTFFQLAILDTNISTFFGRPALAVGDSSVWVAWGDGFQISAAGAPILGPGFIGPFTAPQITSGVSFPLMRNLVVGPNGELVVAFQDFQASIGPSNIFVHSDPDGLGPLGFGPEVLVTSTNVGPFDSVPSQTFNGIDAGVSLAWDRSNGMFANRLYMVYTDEQPQESNNTDILLRFSDDGGQNWSASLRVNDDLTTNGQILPRVAVDQSSGNVAVTWYDSRNDDGLLGPGDTNGLPNDDVQLFGTFSVDGGALFFPNFQISEGTTHAFTGFNIDQLGSYGGLNFLNDVIYPAWTDNSGTAGNDFGLPNTEIYTASVTLAALLGSVSVDILNDSINEAGPNTTTSVVVTRAGDTSQPLTVFLNVLNSGELQSVDEVQTLSSTATGGTFTLTFDGQTTGPLPFNITGNNLKLALEALSNIAVDDVLTAGGALDTGPIVLTFNNNLGSSDRLQISVDNTGLQGGAAAVATTTPGAGVPSSVTIPAGQTSSAPFGILAFDDLLSNGGQAVVIIPSAPGYDPTSDSVIVQDNDLPQLTVVIDPPGQIANGDGPAAIFATVTRNTPTTRVVQPGTVTATTSATSFSGNPALSTTDNFYNGRQIVFTSGALIGQTTVVTGYVGATRTFTVAPALPSAPTSGATFDIVNDTLLVTITSHDQSELRVPVSVVIPAGQSSVTFPIDAFLEFGFDGTTTVQITVSAPGFIHGSDTLDVLESPAFEISQRFGDINIVRPQGNLIIENNEITGASTFGIVVNASPRDGGGVRPHQGAARNTRELNIERWVPGVVVENNVLALNGQGGIQFSGDPNLANSPLSAIPFGRIVNNTIFGSLENRLLQAGTVTAATSDTSFSGNLALSAADDFYNGLQIVFTSGPLNGQTRLVADYDGATRTFTLAVALPSTPTAGLTFNIVISAGDPTVGVGIDIRNFASPTVLNNIVSRLVTGVSITADSASTVLGGTLYKQNTAHTATPASIGLGSFELDLDILSPTIPLFRNPAMGDFTLVEGSLAIDSSIDSLSDRPELLAVTQPLGISQSPILAPELDQLGRLRIDNPLVASPPGLGLNVFKDRGALERLDPVEVSVEDTTVLEGSTGATFAVFTISLSEVLSIPFTVVAKSSAGTATPGSDYLEIGPPPGFERTITFLPGESTQLVFVSVIADLQDENDETFFLSISSASAGAAIDVFQGQATIVDDDNEPLLSVFDQAVPEGNSGLFNVFITLTLTAPSERLITVDFTTADGSATSLNDYVAAAGTVTFTPGESTAVITMQTRGDTLPENDETFLLTLSNAANAMLAPGQSQATITIRDDDATVSISDVTVTEGNTGSVNAVFQVTLSKPTSFPATMNFVTSNITAVASADYMAVSGQVSFAPMETVKTVTVQVLGDVLDEAAEMFQVNLSQFQNVMPLDPVGVGTIQDNDPPPAVSITPAVTIDPEGDSGSSNAIFLVTLVPASGQVVTVPFSTANGTAVAGGASPDYTAVNGTLTFLAGITQQSIIVPVLGDTRPESSETFLVNLLAPMNATLVTGQTQGTVTIIDDEPLMSINDVTIVEPDSGTLFAVFTVSMTRTATAQITVAFATADGTATAAGSDYDFTSGTVTFLNGEFQKSISVAVRGDVFNEGNETFSVNLSNAIGALLTADSVGFGTINDNDQVPRLSISDNFLNEGNTGTTPMPFVVTLSSPSGLPVTVRFATVNGTATAGSDFSNSVGTLTFLPGITQRTLNVSILGNSVSELDEVFFVNLSNEVNAILQDGQGQGTIIDDETTISISDAQAAEASGAGAVFNLTLSKPVSVNVTVVFAAANGSATAGTDFVPTNGTLTFFPNETAKSIVVPIIADQANEPTETFVLNLSGAIGGTVSDNQGLGTIFDDDPPPALFINSITVSEGDSGSANAVLTVNLSAPLNRQVTVNFGTSNGSAIAGADYLPSSGVLTFAPNETIKQVLVPILGDTQAEVPESFQVSLFNAVEAVISGATGTITITDNDPAPFLVTGAGEGGGPHVRVFDPFTGAERFGFFAYSAAFGGGVRVAAADINNDGQADIITVPGPGGGPHLRVFDGRNGGIITEFMAFDGSVTGGLTVATGDVNLDGRPDIIVGTEGGSGAQVKVFNGANMAVLNTFNFPANTAFKGGVHVAAGDVNGDGRADVIIANGPGNTPRVMALDALNSTTLRDFFAYAPNFGGGVYVASGDVDGDGRADIVTGPGFGGGPHLKAFSGTTGQIITEFFAYNPAFTGGVRVATVDANGDGRLDIVTAAGPQGGPHVRIWDAPSRNEIRGFMAYNPAFGGGVFAAGSKLGGGGSPQLAAGGQAIASADAAQLTEAQLQPILRAAADRLQAAGLDRRALDRLSSIDVRVADLADGYLGVAHPNALYLDVNAAGHGWFIDVTPEMDEEFAAGIATGSAAGRMDLLSTVLHELGHALGLADLDGAEHDDDVMSGLLSTGTRRVPALSAVDSIFSEDHWE